MVFILFTLNTGTQSSAKVILRKMDTQTKCCNYPTTLTMWFYHGVMRPKAADGMANRVDPGQIAPKAAVWSGYTACQYLSQKTQDHYSTIWKQKILICNALIQ